MSSLLQFVALACLITRIAGLCGSAPAALKKYHALDPFDSPLHFKVLNGKVADSHIFPFTASVQSRGKYSICTASIIGSRYILTAAHCYYNSIRTVLSQGITEAFAKQKFLEAVNVGYGAVDSLKGKFSDIEAILLPPGSTIDKYEDIMILKLKDEIKFDSNARPVCLSADIKPKVGQELIITGYGNHSTGANTYEKMEQYVIDTIPVVTQSECDEERKNAFCAGGIEKGTMRGDSGGPMYTPYKGHFYQLGVVAAGDTKTVLVDGKEYRDDRALYTQVGNFCDFIKDATGGDVECRKLD
uniref:Peptidase S1 domain-containing protein n=1 Tax=Panagrellus redivivus TaxID=6233 RepID=A0A7E4W4J8_PANRE